MNNRIIYAEETAEEEISSEPYYEMPKFLFEGEFKGLSVYAKYLYMLLKDRHELSRENEWYNDKKELYVIMKREEMETFLNVSATTARRVLKELKDFNLIEEEIQGLTKPNLIYLCEVPKYFTKTN